MKKLIFLIVLTFCLSQSTLAQEAQAPSEKEELIRVNVRNEFDEQIQVQLDKGRKYPVGPKEKITLGERAPGKYTLTIYNKKGEFIDNLTRKIDKGDKNSYRFDLNEKTVSNSDKVTGLSTGQKVAIAGGAIGAAALGTALINKALQQDEGQVAQDQYIPPPAVVPQAGDPTQIVQNLPPVQAVQKIAESANAFVNGGKAFKILNTTYDQITVTVEDPNGNPIGNDWQIPKGSIAQKPQPLVFSGKNIAINPTQRVIVSTPDGYQLQRYAFELDRDPVDGSFVWVIK